ncbi:NAD(P)/FAD-dependent oxidoreductase [Thermovenabulum sp.]|uniref:NAD(P)/FAD-dependent oxidoreductase n=1 Tax=Thermovenabulum sp. TaxID=3100335 RepID=UPI003C7E3478
MKKIAVVGGGAAGLIAAYFAKTINTDVTLFERNHNLGRKILISGKGRCNLTNIKDVREIIENIPGNGKFLYSALNSFSNIDLINFMEKLGVKTKVERGGRVFPVSDKSEDVVVALKRALEKKGIILRLNSRVKEVIVSNGKVLGIKLYDREEYFPCDAVIIATGGLSYPSTGSTGDGYEIARSLGHTIVDLRPSLVPLITKENWVKDLQGLSLKNVEVTSFYNGIKINSEFGEMLFTHYGVSGPVILTISREIVDYINEKKEVIISINLKPALTLEKIYERVCRDFEKYSRKLFKNSLDDLLPKKLIPVIINLSGISPEKPVNQVSKEERMKLVELLSNLKLTVIGCREKEAIITRGGVSVKEINPKTMESKLVKGLYFAGEVIDIDGYTGGFNLQAAFSTGYLAGVNACKEG